MTQPIAKRICVFCSAGSNLSAEVFNQATHFAEDLKMRGYELVYGGGRGGLMGHFADQALTRGVKVWGIIPTYLASAHEVAHTGVTHLEIVGDLMERKRRMIELSDAFVIFPGGFGTLDEALEVITWKVLRQHEKPIVFVNIEGFWQTHLKAFEEFVERGVAGEFANKSYAVCHNSDSLWAHLEQN